MNNSKLIELSKKDGVKMLNLQFTDLLGSLRSVVTPASELENILKNGMWFDGSSVHGFAGINESDMLLKPDAETFALLPWVSKENPTARLISDSYISSSEAFDGCPRNILKRTLEKARAMGYTYYTGPELEFFLFTNGNENMRHVPHDKGGYFDHAPYDSAISIRREIVYALQQFGMKIEKSHHEVATGQHEINFTFNTALKSADNVQTYKHVVKAIANKHNAHATFMPKPVAGINGSGMHTHQSLFDMNGENAFFDDKDPLKLSKIAKNVIAGQLEHIIEIAAVTNPLVNSYKRIIPHHEAPVYITWGAKNRSVLIRVPKCSSGNKNATRIELRCPDPSANPYLAFSLMLAAGLDGIEKGLEPPEPSSENVFEFSEEELDKRGIKMLPGSLEESIKNFKKSSLAKETLGKRAFESYVALKEKEWDSYRKHVTDWEIQNYIDRI